MGLARVDSARTISPQRVLPVRDGFKVRWIDARWVSAKVVDYQAVRDGADKDVIRVAV